MTKPGEMKEDWALDTLGQGEAAIRDWGIFPMRRSMEIGIWKKDSCPAAPIRRTMYMPDEMPVIGLNTDNGH